MVHYFTDNENLKSEFREVKYVYNDSSFTFVSDLGVFSKDKIDYGSKALVETVLKENNINNKKNIRRWLWLWIHRNSAFQNKQ